MKKFLLIFAIASFAIQAIVSENDDEAKIEQSQREAIDETPADHQQLFIHAHAEDKYPSVDDEDASGDFTTPITDNNDNNLMNEVENRNGIDTNVYGQRDDEAMDIAFSQVENDEMIDSKNDEDGREEMETAVGDTEMDEADIVACGEGENENEESKAQSFNYLRPLSYQQTQTATNFFN